MTDSNRSRALLADMPNTEPLGIVISRGRPRTDAPRFSAFIYGSDPERDSVAAPAPAAA